MKCSSIRADSETAAGNPNPPASCVGVIPRGSSSNASGFPRVSTMMRSNTRSSTRAGSTDSSRIRASRRPRGPIASRGSRRAFAALAGREKQRDLLRQQPPGEERERPSRGASSNHCASSTTHNRRHRSPPPTTDPGRQARRGTGSGRGRRSAERDGERVALGIGQAIAELDDRPGPAAGARRTGAPSPLRPRRCERPGSSCELNREVEQSSLAHAGFPVEHQGTPVPGTRALQQALEHLSLSLSAEHLLSKQPRDHMGTLAAPRRSVATAEAPGSSGSD